MRSSLFLGAALLGARSGRPVLPTPTLHPTLDRSSPTTPLPPHIVPARASAQLPPCHGLSHGINLDRNPGFGRRAPGGVQGAVAHCVGVDAALRLDLGLSPNLRLCLSWRPSPSLILRVILAPCQRPTPTFPAAASESTSGCLSLALLSLSSFFPHSDGCSIADVGGGQGSIPRFQGQSLRPY